MLPPQIHLIVHENFTQCESAIPSRKWAVKHRSSTVSNLYVSFMLINQETCMAIRLQHTILTHIFILRLFILEAISKRCSACLVTMSKHSKAIGASLPKIR